MSEIKTVMIESPYSGDIAINVGYAWEALNHSYTVMGEAPVACHLLYTNITGEYISDTGPVILRGREHALKCCEAMRNSCDTTAFYVDLGWSTGMLRAKEELDARGGCYVERRIRDTETHEVELKEYNEAKAVAKAASDAAEFHSKSSGNMSQEEYEGIKGEEFEVELRRLVSVCDRAEYELSSTPYMKRHRKHLVWWKKEKEPE